VATNLHFPAGMGQKKKGSEVLLMSVTSKNRLSRKKDRTNWR
jgi:hypothetical protein